MCLSLKDELFLLVFIEVIILFEEKSLKNYFMVVKTDLVICLYISDSVIHL